MNDEPLLMHGTRKEHINTLKRSKASGLRAIWSGDLRNPYLAENLAFAQREGILELTEYDDKEAQESGYRIKWLRHKEV